MSEEYITRKEAIELAKFMVSAMPCGNMFEKSAEKAVNAIPAADVAPVVRCVKCKYGLPLKAHADGVYGLNCALGRGEEVKNVWHKYSKHYEDYSLVDADGFCDQGEAGEPRMDGDAHV